MRWEKEGGGNRGKGGDAMMKTTQEFEGAAFITVRCRVRSEE
jgi:hypothetical protein